MSDPIIVTYQFEVVGADKIAETIDAINSRAREANKGDGLLGKPEHHEEHAEGLNAVGEAAEKGAKSVELLKSGLEGISQTLVSGSLQASLVGFRDFANTLQGVAESFGGLAGRLAPVGAAIGSVVTALVGTKAIQYELAERAAENVLEFTELAKAAGLTNEQFAKLEGSFRESGVGLDRLHQIVRITSARIQDEWGSIVAAVRDSSDQQEQAAIKVEQANRAQVDSYDSVAQAARRTAAAEREASDARGSIGTAERSEHSLQLQLFQTKLENQQKYEGRAPSADELDTLKRLQMQVDYDKTAQLQSDIERAKRQEQAERDRRDEAEEKAQSSERNEPETGDEAQREADIGVRQAKNAQSDALLRDPAHLAQAIAAGGAGVPWAQVAGRDLFNATLLRGNQNHPELPPLLASFLGASEFMNMPGVPDVASTALTEQFGGRQQIAPLADALKKFAASHGQPLSEEESRTVEQMKKYEKPAEESRLESANLGQATRNTTITEGMRSGSRGAEKDINDSLLSGMRTISSLGDAADKVAGTLNKLNDAGQALGGDQFKKAFDDASSGLEDFGSLLHQIGGAIVGGAKGLVNEALPLEGGKEEGGKPEVLKEGHAAGGHIRGPGSSTSDSIPARLSDGEYVLRAEAVNRIGVSTLNAMNDGAIGFSRGGPVDINETKKRHRLGEGRTEDAPNSAQKPDQTIADEPIDTWMLRAVFEGSPDGRRGYAEGGLVGGSGFNERETLVERALSLGWPPGRIASLSTEDLRLALGGSSSPPKSFPVPISIGAPHLENIITRDWRDTFSNLSDIFRKRPDPEAHPQAANDRPQPEIIRRGAHERSGPITALAEQPNGAPADMIVRDATPVDTPNRADFDRANEVYLQRAHAQATQGSISASHATSWKERGLTYEQAEAEQMSDLYAYNMQGHGYAGGGLVGNDPWGGGRTLADLINTPHRSLSLAAITDGALGGPHAGSSSGGTHVIDLRTDHGEFRVTAASDVLDAMAQSAISRRMTSTGSPSWRG